MARRIIEMEVKKQVVILQSLGYGKKTIARELGLSRNTVKSYLESTSGNEREQPDESRRMEDLRDYLPYCQRELSRKGVTRQILWAEYRSRYPGGYSYSQFCEYLKQYLDRKDVSLHIEQHPGEKMYIDFAGSKVAQLIPSIPNQEVKELLYFISVH